MRSLGLALWFSWLAAHAVGANAGDPFFVDLRAVANTALEDDGIAGNRQGGWSDEGINDMYIYPPVTFGAFTRNGYQFHLIDPQENNGKSVLMLHGMNDPRGKPKSVEVAVPRINRKYLYVLHNSVLRASRQEKNFQVAAYVLTYADGATAELPIRDDLEILHWWTKDWWKNSERQSWPIFMGRNTYSMKWGFHLGVWAMQWEHPQPDKPIVSIEFRSAGKCVPVIWAVTLADEDFFEPEERRKEHFKRPASAPAGYFDAKLALERKEIFQAAVQEGLLTGLQTIELLRADLLAVTVDNAIGRIGAGNGRVLIQEYQTPQTFTIASQTDAHYAGGLHPVEVGRHSCESWRGDIGPYPANLLYFHTFYLKLPRPLQSGHRYTVTIAGLDPPLERTGVLAYDQRHTPTPALKINQVSYAAAARQRYAYLGYWAGDMGAVDYTGFETFQVLDRDSRTILEGRITPRKAGDPLSGEDVYELDLAPLPPGLYRIHVPGLGCSNTFAVGGEGIKSLYYHTQRAFYHQRCGQALEKPYTDFEKPACHLQVYEAGYLVGHPEYRPRPGEAIAEFRGGYHDAADFDCFTYHLRATAQALAAYEQYPQLFQDNGLNIPESGNGIPDILDEADWALFFYRDHQQPDGAVPLGRGNDQDWIRGYERRQGSRPPFGLLPPTTASNAEFAAVAAQYGRLIAPYDQQRAKRYLEAAKKALAWANQRPDREGGSSRGQAEIRPFRAWAAAELYRATGEEEYNTLFKELYAGGAFAKLPWWMFQLRPIVQWPYAICERDGVDRQLQQALRAAIIRMADQLVASTAKPAYRMGAGEKTGGLGWGNGNGGGYYGDVCLRAYWLTGEQRYLDAASLNADFQLGANPLSKSMITGLGARVPRQPQISAFLYTGPKRSGQTVRGIPIYGLASANPGGWHPAATPPWRRWRDISGGAEISSEFTITETVGAAAMLYSSLYALERQ